jgi:hypothetical protein
MPVVCAATATDNAEFGQESAQLAVLLSEFLGISFVQCLGFVQFRM